MEYREDEAEWIRRSRAGDADAFGPLVERYEHMVYALACRLTGSPAESEDLAQEAFIAAFRRLDSLREQTKFSSWLCQITVNTCLNWIKRRQRRDEIGRLWTEQAERDIEPANPAAESATERAGQVAAALQRLPPKQRAALVLTLDHGLSHAEAAAVLGCAEATVSWRVFAARAKLKRWLKP
jgi:RNA polymerase sigma-70 factor (ECF subfamily)